MDIESEFGPSPTLLPDSYPGRWITSPMLVVGGFGLTVKPQPGRRYGQSRVLIPDNPPHRLLDHAGRSLSLRAILLLLNAARMEDRIPHLAVGSNANPARIREKMSQAGTSAVVPMTLAKVTGIDIGFLSKPAGYGVFPATPLLANDATLAMRLVVVWLDAEQSKAVVETELNYLAACTPFSSSPGNLSLQLDNGEWLESAVMYWGENPTLVDPVGRNLVLRIEEDGRIAQGTQNEIRDLVSRGALMAGPVSHAPPESLDWESTSPYGEQGGIGADATGLSVRPTANEWHRRGDSWIVMHPTDAKGRDIGDWSVVTAVNSPLTQPPAIVARVRVADDVALGSVQLDQLIREALGVEIREQVVVTPAHRDRNWVWNLMAPDPTYAVTRVQFTELAAAERDVAIVNNMALRLIGASDGDQIVVEGLPSFPGETVPSIRLKALASDSDFESLRSSISGGGENARFPSATDMLGVTPDLPWIYLDARTRHFLGLGSRKLAAVRIRSSRRHQLSQELRELILVLAIAVLGVLSVVSNSYLRFGLVAALAFVMLLVIIRRLRHRISSRPHSTLSLLND